MSHDQFCLAGVVILRDVEASVIIQRVFVLTSAIWSLEIPSIVILSVVEPSLVVLRGFYFVASY